MPLSHQQLAMVVSIGVLITFLASAIKGSYQVYFVDLVELFGLGRGTFALTGAIFGLSIGLVSPVVGWVCDRYGAAQTIFSGAVVTALAFLLLGFVQWFPLFVFVYGVLCAYALAAMTFVPLALLIDQIFEEKNKGLAFAAMTNGTAIGFILLSPLWVWLNEFLAWHWVAGGIGLVFLLVVVPATWLLHGLVPKSAGNKPNLSLVITEQSSERVLEIRQQQRIKQELTKPLFIFLALSFAGCGASMAYIDVHLVPLMQEIFGNADFKTEMIASTLSILGTAELVGAMVVGWAVRFTRPALFLAGLYAVRAVSLILIAQSHSPAEFIAFALLFGMTYMGTVIITSLLCLQFYGEKIKGKMFGFMFTVHQVAVFATIWLGGMAYDHTGSYQWVTLGVAAFCLLSVLGGLALHWVQQPDPELSNQQSV